MEDKKKSAVDGDKEIIFSRAIKAGKRIYYLDVKKNRKDEMFISITESKKVVVNEGEPDSQVVFEKHKIFLYKEDFSKFVSGLSEMIQFIIDKQGPITPYYNNEYDDNETPAAEAETEGEAPLTDHEIKIDIDF
jgi:hypothetical protein